MPLKYHRRNVGEQRLLLGIGAAPGVFSLIPEAENAPPPLPGR